MGELRFELLNVNKGASTQTLKEHAYHRASMRVVSKETDWLASSPDAIVVDGDNRSVGCVECKVPANGMPKPPTDNHVIQCWMHSYAAGLPWTDYVSLGATHVLVARITFEPDVSTRRFCRYFTISTTLGPRSRSGCCCRATRPI